MFVSRNVVTGERGKKANKESGREKTESLPIGHSKKPHFEGNWQFLLLLLLF